MHRYASYSLLFFYWNSLANYLGKLREKSERCEQSQERVRGGVGEAVEQLT